MGMFTTKKRTDRGSEPQKKASDAHGTTPVRGLVRTFSMVGVLFTVPVAFLLNNFITDTNANIEFSTKERLGVEYLRPLIQLSNLTESYRQIAAAIRRGRSDLNPRLSSLSQGIDAHIHVLDSVNNRLGTTLDLKTQWQMLRQQWVDHKAGGEGTSGEQSDVVLKKLGHDLNSFIVDIADKSNLTLDPEVDTYYLMSTLTTTLPAAANLLAQVDGLGLVIVAQQKLLDEDRLRLTLLVQGELSKIGDQLAANLVRAYSTNDTLHTTLDTKVAAVTSGISSTLKAAQEDFLKAKSINISIEQWQQFANKANDSVQALADTMTASLDALLQARVQHVSSKQDWNTAIAIGLLAIATGILFLLARTSLRTARASAEQAEKSANENSRNQRAILNLLDELGNLADGDLTAKAKVTEDITGAIADSINYTVEELRTLVQRVNTASTEVTAKSNEAREVSTKLLAAAERQLNEIKETSASMTEVTASVNTVAATATESANVAKRSLIAAEQGTEAVQNSIRGMNEIREQIQETAKRIKRLGESSQEIGEIVEMISDITEQTNVLALNAAIQSAAAGEAGRGFAVVAEEVQRLAERSGDATKQIGGLVKAIQRDTQEAVAAMEKSTQEVVEGARLSDAAGVALAEIRAVSSDLAHLIDNIFKASQVQSKLAGQMSQGMQSILGITQQTTTGTKLSADSIGQLTKLATDLKTSVAGFKL